jgi:hypothetical protein
MTAEPLTTIKVPKQLRARVTRSAADHGLTAAGLITVLLDEHERRRRFEAVRAAYAVEDPTYAEEVEAWDGLAGDGLDS